MRYRAEWVEDTKAPRESWVLTVGCGASPGERLVCARVEAGPVQVVGPRRWSWELDDEWPWHDGAGEGSADDRESAQLLAEGAVRDRLESAVDAFFGRPHRDERELEAARADASMLRVALEDAAVLLDARSTRWAEEKARLIDAHIAQAKVIEDIRHGVAIGEVQQ